MFAFVIKDALHDSMQVNPQRFDMVFVESVFMRYSQRKEVLRLLFQHFKFKSVALLVEETALLFSHLKKHLQTGK